jgi:hypothetical protein
MSALCHWQSGTLMPKVTCLALSPRMREAQYIDWATVAAARQMAGL